MGVFSIEVTACQKAVSQRCVEVSELVSFDYMFWRAVNSRYSEGSHPVFNSDAGRLEIVRSIVPM
jgi:hypothetical protein